MQLSNKGERDGTRLLAAAGRITQSELTAAGRSLESLLGETGFAQPAALDLERAEFIDSSGIGWLLDTHKRFRAAGGRLVLHSTPPMIDRVLRLMKLDTVLFLAADEAAAILRSQERSS